LCAAQPPLRINALPLLRCLPEVQVANSCSKIVPSLEAISAVSGLPRLFIS